MAPRPAPSEAELPTRTAALVQAWEENLAQAEPNRQRVFSDYQALSDAGQYLARWLRDPQRPDAQREELRALATRVSACLAFAAVAPERAGALKRHLFSGRSRGCRGGPSPLEVEILENLEARAEQG